MGAKVERRREDVMGEGMKRERWGEEGVARTCWIFLAPERCVRIEGHLMARERSRWRRAVQESGPV